MPVKLEELNSRSEHDIKAVKTRTDEILQRAEAVVSLLRIDEVHRHVSNLDATPSQTVALLGARADDSDQRIAGFEHQLNSMPLFGSRETGRAIICDYR